MTISFLLYLSVYPGLLEIRTQTWHPWRQIPALVYASLIVSLRKDWDSFKTWYCEYFLLINFNIITRNYCLNKTTLILVVAFLLSVSRYIMTLVSLSLIILIGVRFHLYGIFWKQKPWRCVVFSEEILSVRRPFSLNTELSEMCWHIANRCWTYSFTIPKQTSCFRCGSLHQTLILQFRSFDYDQLYVISYKIQKWVPLRPMKTVIRKKMGHTT